MKAESRHLLHLGQRQEGRRVARRRPGDHAAGRVSWRRTSRRRPRSRSSPGRAIARCTSASPPRTSAQLRESYPGVVGAGAPGMPARGGRRSRLRRLDRGDGRLSSARSGRPGSCCVTECSMSDNVAAALSRGRVRAALQSVPAHEADHACRRSATRSRRCQHEVTIDPAVAERARLRGRAHARCALRADHENSQSARPSSWSWAAASRGWRQPCTWRRCR